MHRDPFSSYHPIVNLTFFLLALGLAMCSLNPFCLAIALVSASAYGVRLRGWRHLLRELKWLLPLMLLTAVISPLFNHEGVTTLFWLPSGNAVTAESILYGVATAAMLMAVISWFSCWNVVMTSDKFIYLFGKIIPNLSLVLSMTLNFVPRFTGRIRKISAAQPRPTGREGLTSRLRRGVKILSAAVTWALESSIDTADSMKSRGYGLGGRTSFSIYKFTARDGVALAFLLICGAYVIVGAALGGLKWRYFPSVRGDVTGYGVSVLAAYLALCLTPLAADVKEGLKWAKM
jgi:energy-coupling factor transport system permease protein